MRDSRHFLPFSRGNQRFKIPVNVRFLRSLAINPNLGLRFRILPLYPLQRHHQLLSRPFNALPMFTVLKGAFGDNCTNLKRRRPMFYNYISLYKPPPPPLPVPPAKADFAVEVRPEREMVLVRTRSAATMRPAASRMVLRDNGQARRAANNRRLEPNIPGGAWPR